MIQTLSPNISTGSILGQALGQGVQTGMQTGFQRAGEQRNQSLLNQALTQAQQIYADPNLSPEEKQIHLYKVLSHRPEIAQELSRQQLERENIASKIGLEKEKTGLKEREVNLLEGKEKRKRDILSQFLGSSEKPDQFLQEEKLSPAQKQKTAEDLTDQQIIAIAQDDPNLARILQGQKETLIKNRIDIHKDSAKFDEKVSEDAEKSVRQLEAVKDIRDAITTGKVTPFKLANVFRPISETLSNAFKNAEQGKIEAALPNLLEGWKQVFGVRLSDADLKVLLGKLPDIGKSREANESVLNILEKYAEPVLLKRQVAREIKKEYGGFRPLNFQDLVEEEAEKRISQRKQIEQKTQLTEEIIDRYLEMSGNDPIKAAQMAKEDGYEF